MAAINNPCPRLCPQTYHFKCGKNLNYTAAASGCICSQRTILKADKAGQQRCHNLTKGMNEKPGCSEPLLALWFECDIPCSLVHNSIHGIVQHIHSTV